MDLPCQAPPRRGHALFAWLRCIFSLSVAVGLFSICKYHWAARNSLTKSIFGEALAIQPIDIASSASTREQSAPPSFYDYLWWPFGLYLFWCQSHVCEVFFIKSIEVCSEMFKIPEDVAGATLMAFGCNGPELAVNAIALFITKSDVGVGTIVGSDVFNLLVIAGSATLAAPTAPVELDVSPVIRDILFYTISIVLLCYVISDGRVDLWQAALLSSMTAVYALVVAKWSCITGKSRRQAQQAPEEPNKEERPATPIGSKPPKEVLEKGVKVKVRRGGPCGRFETKWGKAEWYERFMRLKEGVLYIEKEKNRTPTNSGVMQRARSSSNPSTPLSRRHSDSQALMGLSSSHDFVEASTLFGGGVGDYERFEIDLRDIQKCVKEGASRNDGLVGEGAKFWFQFDDGARTHCPAIAKPIVGKSFLRDRAGSSETPESSRERSRVACPKTTLEMEVDEEHYESCIAVLAGREAGVILYDVEELRKDVEELRKLNPLDPSSRSWKQNLQSILVWFQYPVLLSLEMTIPKCFDPPSRKRWPLTFVMSMAWLAFFSYWICAMADAVHDLWAIPSSLLGLTLAAVGTSFPNCVASVLVAREGKCGMAVANLFGSNIQNVFLALGIPWFLNAAVNGGSFPQSTKGIASGVISMGGSLLLFIVFAVCGRGKLSRFAAITFLLAYLAFFVFSVLQSYSVI